MAKLHTTASGEQKPWPKLDDAEKRGVIRSYFACAKRAQRTYRAEQQTKRGKTP